MSDDYVGAQIRRINRNVLFVGIFCGAVAIAIVVVLFINMDGRIFDFSEGTWVPLAIALGFLIAAIAAYRKRQHRITDPGKHPVMEWLAGYGDPAVVRQQIENEIRQAKPLRFGSALVTESWILVPSRWSMWLMNLNSVAWVYQKVTQHSTNGIPTGKTYQACFRSKEGAQFDLKLSKKNAEAFLRLINDRQPWAILGFSDEKQKAYTSDRANFVAVVNQRRNELEDRRPMMAP